MNSERRGGSIVLSLIAGSVLVLASCTQLPVGMATRSGTTTSASAGAAAEGGAGPTEVAASRPAGTAGEAEGGNGEQGAEAPPLATPIPLVATGEPPPSASGGDGAEPPATEQPRPTATTAPERDWVVFPHGTYLFIEIVEERVMKTESAGQTTSFAGDRPTYQFDAATGTLTGQVKGPWNEAALTVVGRVVVNQIDRSTSAVGQLYALVAEGQQFGAVAVERVTPDGTVVVEIDGQLRVLRPGESYDVAMGARPGADRLAVSSATRTVTVFNHGFLQRSGMTLGEP